MAVTIYLCKKQTMKVYKHLFFDLDRTLWDYGVNSSEALHEVYNSFALESVFKSGQAFVDTFQKHNEWVWWEYKNDRMSKTVLRTYRFELTLEEFGVKNPGLAEKLNDAFLSIMPGKTALIDGTWEILEYLSAKNYPMYIVTNGFVKVQEEKLASSRLNQFFRRMFSSEEIGANKPKPQIFEWALKSANARKSESVMIGDELFTDILGAKKFGMDQIYYNPEATPHQEEITFEIRTLLELKTIL